MSEGNAAEMMRHMMKCAQEQREARAASWPDEAHALDTLCDLRRRLEELGWSEASLAPRNHKPLLFIEAGCSRVLRGYRDEVGFWVSDGGDMWPSHPMLFKVDPDPLVTP